MVIYLTKNLINGKQYIGKDINNNPNYLGSGTYIKKAIIKYGKNNFEKIILEKCNSKEELWKREEWWLNFYQAETNPLFYNKTNKAFGNSGQTEHGKLKIAEYQKGKVRSEETKKRMSENRKGHKMYNDEWKEKISQSLIGKTRTKEWKDKQSEILKGNKNRRKKVMQYDKQKNFIKEWDSVLEAAIFLNKKTGAAITEVCSGKRKSIYGYIWEYKK
jgi:group I intron endonuclease